MRNLRTGLFYVGMIAFFSSIIYWITQFGGELENGRDVIHTTLQNSQWQAFKEALTHNLKHPLAILLVQIITIIIFARIMGWVCQKIGQPIVIGEILAGIMLGPSLFGMYFPDLSQSLFPVQSLGNLQNLSQIGLILFMFIVGIELDLNVLKKKAKIAIVVSHMGIIIPFTLGIGLAFFIYHSFAPKGVPFLSFALFLGIAMSIAAFPVLARIIQERGIHKTRLGTFVITCAAIDDITAWCLLAAVIAIVKAGSFVSSLYTIMMATTYVLVMIKLVRPFLKRVGDLHDSRENLSKPIVAIFFLTLILSAYTSEIIGIHVGKC
jgi:Kef-type K+ transport system membrane component KefB